MEENQIKTKNEQKDFEAEQNWLGFWDLIIKEYIRQFPEEYKKFKQENNKIC